MDQHQAELAVLIRRAKDKGDLIATTLRLPPMLHAEVEELADDLGVSRQAMLTILVGVGAKEARKKADQPDDTPGKFHVLNTNRRNSDHDEDWMLKNEAAAAFYDPWKFQIDNIKEGDVVFLYSSGVGIIAFGTASGDRQIGDYNEDKGERYFQKLTNFRRLQKPYTAQQIKETLGRNVTFLPTRFPLPDGEKLFNKVKQLRAALID